MFTAAYFKQPSIQTILVFYCPGYRTKEPEKKQEAPLQRYSPQDAEVLTLSQKDLSKWQILMFQTC
jgi:hypothetical protein